MMGWNGLLMFFIRMPRRQLMNYSDCLRAGEAFLRAQGVKGGLDGSVQISDKTPTAV